MLTRPWVIPKVENCRDANFASPWSLQVVIIMTTWVMTMLASWRLSVFSAMSYQILTNILWYHCTIYDNLTYSTTVNLLSKCDMNQYFTLATFCNHFVRYHIFMMKCNFKQPSQYIGREHMLFPYMQWVWIIVIITCVRKWSFKHWDWDTMTTICISFPNTFFQTTKNITAICS